MGASTPRTSVIIPVPDSVRTIGAQLDALAGQRGGSFEVIVVDNGSSDGTVTVARRFQDRLPRLTVVDAFDRPGPAHARNEGASRAAGKYLLFCDADDIVGETWIASLEEALVSHGLVTGVLDEAPLNDVTLRSPTRGPTLRSGIHDGFGFLPFAPTANLGIRSSIFQELGGFNTAFTAAAGEDVDLCWRAQLAGHELVEVPRAVVAYRMPRRLWPSMRQSYRHAVAVPILYSMHAAAGMPGRPVTRTLRSWLWLATRLDLLARGRANRGRWFRHLAVNLARIIGSVQARVRYL